MPRWVCYLLKYYFLLSNKNNWGGNISPEVQAEPFLPGSITLQCFPSTVEHEARLPRFGVCVINRDIHLSKRTWNLTHALQICESPGSHTAPTTVDVGFQRFDESCTWQMMGKGTCGSPEDIKTVDTKMISFPYDTRLLSFLMWKETTFSEKLWEIFGLKKCPPNFLSGL